MVNHCHHDVGANSRWLLTNTTKMSPKPFWLPILHLYKLLRIDIILIFQILFLYGRKRMVQVYISQKENRFN